MTTAPVRFGVSVGTQETSDAEADSVVKRDASGNFAAGTITAALTGNVTGNASTASAWQTARDLSLTGDVTATLTAVSGSGSVSASAAIASGAVTAAKLSGAQTGSAPVFGVRAWVNFNGTRNESDTGAGANGANVLIKAGGNVASVLRNGTGDYTITFTTAISDANYAFSGSVGRDNQSAQAWVGGPQSVALSTWKTTGSLRVSLMSATTTELSAAPSDVSILVLR
jgi:trimeric autotransporter adhesin